MLACGGREAMVMALPPMCDSGISSCFHSCPAFLHRHFLPQSPPWPPLNLCLCSQQQPSPQDHSTLPNPAASPSRVPLSLSRVYMVEVRTVWFSLHLGCHRSAVLLTALNVSPLTQTIAPCEDQTPVSVPPPTEGRYSPTNTPVFPPSSFVLPSFA